MFSKLTAVTVAIFGFHLGSSAYAGGVPSFGEDRSTEVVCKGDLGDLNFSFPGLDYRGEHLDLNSMGHAKLIVQDSKILDRLVRDRTIFVIDWKQTHFHGLHVGFLLKSPGIGLAYDVSGGTFDLLFFPAFKLLDKFVVSDSIPVRSEPIRSMRQYSQYSLRQIDPYNYQLEISVITPPTEECVATEIVPNPWAPGKMMEQCSMWSDRDPQDIRVVFTENLKIHRCQKFRRL